METGSAVETAEPVPSPMETAAAGPSPMETAAAEPSAEQTNELDPDASGNEPDESGELDQQVGSRFAVKIPNFSVNK